MPRDRRQTRDLHALDGNGMVLCNPRDREAAHRAQMEGIATDDRNAVTCRKCLSLLKKLREAEEADRDDNRRRRPVGGRTVSKTYVSDITHLLNDLGQFKDMPVAARRMAEFLLAIVEAVTRARPADDTTTGVRCRKRGCKGIVRASLVPQDEEIVWNCAGCGDNGVIRNWQGTHWDQSSGVTALPDDLAKSASRPKYTRKEGQYLAFIYYYSKLNKQAPAERDMQVYFQVTPPAVHDMVLRLEKRGFISREPGVPRSIRLLLSREKLPDLE